MNIISVDEGSNLNTVSIDKVTQTLSITDQMQRVTTLAQPEFDIKKCGTQSEHDDNDTEKDKDVDEQVVRHIGGEDSLRSVVH